MKYYIPLALSVLLFFAVGSVSALQISPTSITLPTNSAYTTNITFYNNQNATINISINSGFVRANYGYYFSNFIASPSIFSIAPGQSKTVSFFFKTNDVFFSSPVQISVPYSANGSPESFAMDMLIIPYQDLIYFTGIHTAPSIYPNQEISSNVTILNGLGQTGVVLPLNYSLYKDGVMLYTFSHTIILENLGSNSFGFSFPINSSTRPGTYVLSVSLKYTGNYSIINSSITVLPYYSYTKKPVSSFGLFGGESSVTIKNTGNEPIPSKNLSLSVAGISSLFLISKYSSLGSPVISNGVLYPSVPYLQPGQTISMSYSESFIPLYVIILIVIAAIVIFFYLNRKVVITKEVAEHKAVGGFIDVKIAIRVRNVSKRPLTSISVKDWVPPNSLKVSSIGPKEGKIARQGNNVHINWMEDNLNPGDEIILMYSIKSKIGIIGSIKLSKATVRFEYNSKKYEKKSNSLVLNIK